MTYEDYFLMFLQLKGLQHETVMEFDYQILLSADSPLALYPVIAEKDLDGYIEIVHGDTQLPSGEYLELPPDSGRGSQADRIYCASGEASSTFWPWCPIHICGYPPCQSRHWSGMAWSREAAQAGPGR